MGVDLRAKPYYLNEEQIRWVEDTLAGMSEDEKISYWINTVEKVFVFLEAKMRCEDDKLKRYITCLRESDIKMYKQKVTESYDDRT